MDPSRVTESRATPEASWRFGTEGVDLTLDLGMRFSFLSVKWACCRILKVIK
jgi:hypothetical protein